MENKRCRFIAVYKFVGRLHADLQLDLHDAFDRALVGLSPVSRAHASRIPIQLVGGHQRASGILT